MITQDKIKIYKKYDGDIDNWARTASKKDKLVMDDDDWYIIDRLVQDLSLTKKELTSQDFIHKLSNKLKENCDSEETIQALKTIK